MGAARAPGPQSVPFFGLAGSTWLTPRCHVRGSDLCRQKWVAQWCDSARYPRLCSLRPVAWCPQSPRCLIWNAELINYTIPLYCTHLPRIAKFSVLYVKALCKQKALRKHGWSCSLFTNSWKQFAWASSLCPKSLNSYTYIILYNYTSKVTFRNSQRKNLFSPVPFPGTLASNLDFCSEASHLFLGLSLFIWKLGGANRTHLIRSPREWNKIMYMF